MRVVGGFSARGVARGTAPGQSDVQGSRCAQLMVELLPTMTTVWSVDETLIGIRSGRFYPPDGIKGSQAPILWQPDGVQAEPG